MHLDLEISEKDYLQSDYTVMRPSTVDLQLVLFPVICALVGLYFIYESLLSPAMTSQAFRLVIGSILVFVAALVPAVLWVSGRRLKRTIKQVHASITNPVGRFSFEVNENGVQLLGPRFSWKAGWQELERFSEDRKFFFLYQQNPDPDGPSNLYFLPKRTLSHMQVVALRQSFEQNMGREK
jgi:hypothetical protein